MMTKDWLIVIVPFIGLLVIVQYPIIFWLLIIGVGLYFYFKFKAKKDLEKKILESGIKEIDVMQGEEFEQYLAVLFRDMGYKVETTPRSGDYGADLILEKAREVIAVQVKRYNRTVGLDAVQQVSSAIPFYNAHKGWVITNNRFSESAYTLARKNNIQLINREQLIELISHRNRIKKIQ
ncbi:restriction endonuclease [Bacillus sp. NPDC094106]|uniref:restriction endonuclease n=1 Tax=Bacillus sp. NPDC094106 TaxID=3363949 RepID=UPI00381AA446